MSFNYNCFYLEFPRIPDICEYAANIREYMYSFVSDEKKFEYREYIQFNFIKIFLGFSFVSFYRYSYTLLLSHLEL